MHFVSEIRILRNTTNSEWAEVNSVARHFCLPLSLPESIMETCSVVLTSESVDEILWCDHSNETSSAVLLHGTICFSIFYKLKLGIFLTF